MDAGVGTMREARAQQCALHAFSMLPEVRALSERRRSEAFGKLKVARKFVVRGDNYYEEHFMVLAIVQEHLLEKPPTKEETAAELKAKQEAEAVRVLIASGGCPSGWTPATDFVCYRVLDVTLDGVVPVVKAQIVTDRYSSLELRVVLFEGEARVCSDEAPLSGLRPGEIVQFNFKCSKEQLIGDVARLKGVIIVLGKN